MSTIKVDNIDTSAAASVTIKQNVVLDANKSIATAGTGGLTVAGVTTLNSGINVAGAAIACGSQAITGCHSITTSNPSTMAGINCQSALNLMGSDGSTKQTISNVAALDCTTLSVGGAAFSVNLKAFGEIAIADTNTDDAPTVSTGDFNLETCTHSAASNIITVNFTTALSGVNYVPLIWMSSDATDVFRVIALTKATGNMQITYQQRVAIGGAASTGSEAIKIYLAILEV